MGIDGYYLRLIDLLKLYYFFRFRGTFIPMKSLTIKAKIHQKMLQLFEKKPTEIENDKMCGFYT